MSLLLQHTFIISLATLCRTIHKFNHVPPSLPFLFLIRFKREIPIQARREKCIYGEGVWLCVIVTSRNMCRVCTSRAKQELTNTSSLFLVSDLLLLLTFFHKIMQKFNRPNSF